MRKNLLDVFGAFNDQHDGTRLISNTFDLMTAPVFSLAKSRAVRCTSTERTFSESIPIAICTLEINKTMKMKVMDEKYCVRGKVKKF